jgi:hypothetical protein
MVITIVGALSAVASMYIKETIDLWSFMSFRNEVVAQERMAMFTMAREIRQAKDNNSVYNTTNATRFRFQDFNNTTIDYQLVSGNIMRNADVLVNGVTNFTLTYYDANNNLLAAPAFNPTNIYRVTIDVTVQAGGRAKSLRTQVFPRNF